MSHATAQFAISHVVNVFDVAIPVSVFVEKSAHLFAVYATKQSLLNLFFMV